MLLEGGATAASLALAGTVAFKWIRPKFPISVNCWFCQEDQSVPYDCRNAWVCGGCQQYNGFNKDGDYNRDIPEMHRDVSIVGTQRMGKTTTPSVPDNGLCATCNLHQELKIHQLAKFVPLNAWDYDREIEDYSAHLNRTYRLCRSCEAIVHQKLGEQDSGFKRKILSWKVEMSRLTAAKSAQILKDNIREKNIPLILGSAILGFAILINLHVVTNGISKSDFNSLIRGCGQILFLHKIDLSFLVIAMILGTFTLIGFSRSKKLVSNGTAINIFLWLTLGSLLFWCRLGYFQDVIREFVPVLSLIILAGAVINFALQIKFKPQRRSKVRRTPPPDPMQQQQQADSQQLHVSADGQAPGSPHSPLSDHSSLKESTLTQDLLSDNSNSNSSSQATNTAPFPPKQSLVDSACHSEVGYPPNPEVLQVPVNPDNEIRRRRRNCDLSSLSISDDEGNEELNFDCSRSVFWKKRYNGFNKSGINFGPPVSRSSSLRGNQSLLRPATFSPTPGSSPKINSFSSRSTSSGRVAKASWVAGGYWQRKPNYFRNSNNNSHIMDDEDSRPSSKSSGFISTSGKNLTNGFLPAGSGSRACSLFGDQGGIERAPSVVGLESVINKSAYQPQGLLQQSSFSQHAMIRTSSQKGSSDCSDDLISQISALGGDMTPRASSSPIAATAKNVKKPPGHPTPTNWMEKQISCTVFNLLLGISVALNVLVLPIVAYKLLE